MYRSFLSFFAYNRIFGNERNVIHMSLLEIEGLTHSFGENLLYKNAELTLNKGGILELWDKMELEKVH